MVLFYRDPSNLKNLKMEVLNEKTFGKEAG
jgi:hypothetical protein